MNCIDSREPDTIIVAHKRVETILPEKFRMMVTDHIPTVLASRVFNESAISTTRLLVRDTEQCAQLKEAIIQKHARVRVWMDSRKLEPVHNLEPSVFWRVFWETLQCALFC